MLLLLATDAGLMGTQRSALELAFDCERTRCRAFCTHARVQQVVAVLFDGLVPPIPQSAHLAPVGSILSAWPRAERAELNRVARAGLAPSGGLVRQW